MNAKESFFRFAEEKKNEGKLNDFIIDNKNSIIKIKRKETIGGKITGAILTFIFYCYSRYIKVAVYRDGKKIENRKIYYQKFNFGNPLFT